MRSVPFLSTNLIERLIAERLAGANMKVTPERPVLDLLTFVQGPLSAVLDDYAELPPDVMGVVVFEHGKKDHVQINRDLTIRAEHESEFTALARARSTLAHEAAHIILHRTLLMPAPGQGSLFGEETPVAHVQRCFKKDFGRIIPQASSLLKETQSMNGLSKDADNMEIQANKGMAALLLPREVFCPMAVPLLQTTGHREAVLSLSAHFVVSRRLVEIRIDTLGLNPSSQQSFSL